MGTSDDAAGDSGDYIRCMQKEEVDGVEIEIEREAYEPSWYRIMVAMQVRPPDADEASDDRPSPRAQKRWGRRSGGRGPHR
jgi:hypothetical protein